MGQSLCIPCYEGKHDQCEGWEVCLCALRHGGGKNMENDEVEKIEEIMEVFFSNPHNRLIMAMFGVHDGEMSVQEAIEFSKTGKVTKKK